MRWGSLLLVLVIAASVRLPGVFVRSIWYDETITLRETSKGPSDSPEVPTPAGELRAAFDGTPTLREVTDALRSTDVHPPVYYWILTGWRTLMGRSIETARLLSLLFSVGAVGVFWWLLRRTEVENPLIPAVVYALSKYAVHYGHEARGYALGSLLLISGLLAGVISLQVPAATRARATALSCLAALLLAASFLASYLTMFAIPVILAWMLFVAGPGGRSRAALTALATPLLAASGLFLLRLTHQFAARPHQDVGFRGYLAEALVVLKGLTEVVCKIRGVDWFVLSAMIGALAAVTLWHAWKGGSTTRWERRLVVLALGLVAGQALGVYAMDLVLSKHLATARYLLYAGPALAILVAIGATRLRGRGRWPARTLLLSLVALQVAGVNWNRPDCRAGRSFGPYRPVAGELRAEARRPALAVVGTGYGRGDLWSWVYELPAETPVLFLGWDEDGSGILPFAPDFEEIWILGATDGRTRNSEDAFRERLIANGWRPLRETSWHGAIRLGRPTAGESGGEGG